ncbi:MAG TPA: ABATE domain-containing protein [Alphaproteobacteria bacterium]|nr:ABATE domain-containing protein [Alphaproteobacteria bacterium]
MGKSSAVSSSDWRDGFLFVGNQLILDFLNTCPVQDNQPMELLPDVSALLRWFHAAELLSAQDAASLQRRWADSIRARRTLQAMRALREKLRKDVLAWEHGSEIHQSTLAELNGLMADHPMLSRVSMGKGMELWFPRRQPEDLFAPLAFSAANLFTNVDRTRVRKCDQCILHFHDTSKKGTRRWCSMQLCGNRIKVAAYAARNRANK